MGLNPGCFFENHWLYAFACTCTCFTERWEGRKKEASKVKQTTRQSNTAHPRQSLFLRKMRQKNELSQVELEPTTLYTLDRTSYITAAQVAGPKCTRIYMLGELSVQWDVLVDAPVGSSSLWSFGIHTHTHSHSYIHNIVYIKCAQCTTPDMYTLYYHYHLIQILMYMYIPPFLGKVTALGVLCCFALLFV